MDKTEKLTLRECLLGDRAFYRHVLLVVLPTWRVRMTPRELEVSVGVLFPVLHRMPRLTVCGLQRVTTPVLRRAGLCLAWVHGAGGQTCLLPLLPAEDLDALCRALGL